MVGVKELNDAIEKDLGNTFYFDHSEALLAMTLQRLVSAFSKLIGRAEHSTEVVTSVLEDERICFDERLVDVEYNIKEFIKVHANLHVLHGFGLADVLFFFR